jgi:hypothetical protein
MFELKPALPGCTIEETPAGRVPYGTAGKRTAIVTMRIINKKITTRQSIERRDRFVDSMAKKLANAGGVEKVITTYRRRRIEPMKYVYIAIAVSALSTTFTYLVMTGRVAPGLMENETAAPVAPVKSMLDLLNDDLAAKSVGPDQYALYLRDFLIRYDSLPERYKPSGSGLTSEQVYAAMYAVWPRVSLRTRGDLLKTIPFLAERWDRMRVEQPPPAAN